MSKEKRNISVIKDAEGNKIVMINDIIKGRWLRRKPMQHRDWEIRHAKDNKMYLYDVLNIKKETSKSCQA